MIAPAIWLVAVYLVDDAAAINDTDDSTDAQLCNTGIPFDLDKLCAEGVRGVVTGLRICAQTA